MHRPPFLLLLSTVTLYTLVAVTNGATHCTNSELQQTDVDAILDQVNSARKKVLEGDQRNGITGENLPAAISIPALVWSCPLEEEGLKIAQEMCDRKKDLSTSLDKKSYISYLDLNEVNIPKAMHEDLVEADYNNLKRFEGTNVTYSGEANLDAFVNLIRSTTTEIGCSRLECPNYNNNPGKTLYIAMCVTNQPRLKQDETIYEAVDPNNACPTHPYMTNSVRTVFLNKHNTLRSLLAIGTAKNGGTGQMCKTSINMPTLVYDCELEKAAYERAKFCENFADNTTHIFHENRWKYTRSLDDEFELIANRVTQRWWSELDKSAGIPQPENIYTTGLNINSFAKIASDLTIRLGCGIYKCTDMVNVVCHYETALEEGRRLYIAGPKCQKCAKTCAVGLCPTVAEGVHVYR